MKTKAVLLLLLGLGCAAPPRTNRAPSYPVERAPAEADVRDKDENPSSQAWPLDRWLVEFENRNGVELKYREQDTFGREVVQPGPGPYDSDQEAMDTLRRVARKNGLSVSEVGRHVY
ncbi:MAG TPA: hypothetical protein VFF73_00495, partial [Planctomycetota bacterium]|nr:hypothetical protein [Planctomycetota bacterium]